jgi:hypothetical protein
MLNMDNGNFFVLRSPDRTNDVVECNISIPKWELAARKVIILQINQ